jgi:hypothetical protein
LQIHEREARVHRKPLGNITKQDQIESSLPKFETVFRFGYEIIARTSRRGLSTASLDEIIHRAQHEIASVR